MPVAARQSVVPLQPQVYLLLPSEMQRWPGVGVDVQSMQVFEPPHAEFELPAVHMPVVWPVGILQQKPPPQVPLPAPPQFAVQAPAVQVGLSFAHAAQRPLAPHAVFAVPAAQVPFVWPVATLQQPPLHAWFELQVVVHLCAVVSQAKPVEQSAEELQPQAMPLMHWLPFCVAQLEQMAAVAQVVCAVPALHVPVVWPAAIAQQPPLQAWFAAHVVVH